MEAHWWHLPGPARFTQAIIQDFRSGKNVVLSFPPYAPDGFREALAERVRDNDLWRWRTISATELPSDGAASLTESLYERLIAGSRNSDLCSALTLAQRLVGTIVWVENAVGESWSAWCKFLFQYQHACQSCDTCDRSMFCLPIEGNSAPIPSADVALSVRQWEGAVSRLDMTLYLDRAVYSRFRHPLLHKVALAVIAELAGSDPSLAWTLANEEFATIMSPFETLLGIAANRNWTAEFVANPTWHNGTSNVIDGTRISHSAAVAASGNRGEITRRVWKGQVAVIYPFIEEQRIKIIPQVRGYLRLPVETTYGQVIEAEDLEVGQLLYFLRGKKIQPRLWRMLNFLTDMRHALAHLEPVPIRTLLADEILHVDG